MRDPQEGLTDDGFIRTGVRPDRIPSEFSPIIEEALRTFAADREPDWELHLYGSVATGGARVGRSDVDLVLVNGSPTWAQDVSARLTDRYARLCRGVEIGAAQHSDYLGEGDKAYGNRVFLRHYCMSLTGPTGIALEPAYRGDRRAARGFNGDIAAEFGRWLEEGATARRIARKTLLATAGLMSVRTGTWTTDRATAAQLWVHHRPADRDAMALLERHARSADGSALDLIDELLAPGGVVADVVDSFVAEIGTWS